MHSKNESFIHVIVKKEREICASLAFAPQITKVIATVHGKCLAEMVKALNLYNKIFGERKKPQSYNFYYSILLLFSFIIIYCA